MIRPSGLLVGGRRGHTPLCTTRPMDRAVPQAQVIEAIRRAFAGVAREDGVTLHEADVGTDLQQRFMDAAEVAGTVIKQSNHNTINNEKWKK